MCSLTDGHCNMTSLFYSCILCSRAEMRLTHANFVLLHGRESDTVFSGLFVTETFHSPAAIDKTVRRECWSWRKQPSRERVCYVSNRFVFVCIWDLGRKLSARLGGGASERADSPPRSIDVFVESAVVACFLTRKKLRRL